MANKAGLQGRRVAELIASSMQWRGCQSTIKIERFSVEQQRTVNTVIHENPILCRTKATSKTGVCQRASTYAFPPSLRPPTIIRQHSSSIKSRSSHGAPKWPACCKDSQYKRFHREIEDEKTYAARITRIAVLATHDPALAIPRSEVIAPQADELARLRRHLRTHGQSRQGLVDRLGRRRRWRARGRSAVFALVCPGIRSQRRGRRHYGAAAIRSRLLLLGLCAFAAKKRQ